MSQELQLGKYEFYPYPKEYKDPPLTLEELVELLRKTKDKGERDVETSSRSVVRRRPRVNDVAKRRERDNPRDRG